MVTACFTVLGTSVEIAYLSHLFSSYYVPGVITGTGKTTVNNIGQEPVVLHIEETLGVIVNKEVNR